MRSRHLFWLMALPALCTGAGCSQADSTAILVTFQSSLVPGSGIDRIDLSVFVEGQEYPLESFDVGPAPFDSFPQTLLILPGPITRNSNLLLVARGFLETYQVAYDERETRFVSGEVTEVTLIFDECLDTDSDSYGVGEGCPVQDCNDDDPTVYPGASELCDQKDNDCDNQTDEDFDLNTDPLHCGACNNACPNPDFSDAKCAGGQCDFTCHIGYTECGEICVDLQSDPQHCGTCTNVCPDPPPNADAVCVDAVCGWECQTGYTQCGQSCVDTRTDPLNCGTCDNACPQPQNATARCNNGSCDFVCDTGYEKCTDVCVDTDTDTQHCGSCDNACPQPANSDAVCQAGSCDFVCHTGYVKCITTCEPEGQPIVYSVPSQYTTIQAAINAATCNDTRIEVAAGVYNEEIDLRGLQLHILAVDGPLVTRIAGVPDNETPTVSIVSGEPAGTRIENFTIGGDAGSPAQDFVEDGAVGVMIAGSSATLAGNNIDHNQNIAPSQTQHVAGGVSVSGASTVTIEGGSISNNVADCLYNSDSIGGLWVKDGAQVFVSGTSMQQNQASCSYGSNAAGGILVESGQATVTGSLIQQCDASVGNMSRAAGAILVINGTLDELSDSDIRDNLTSAEYNSAAAGGLLLEDASVQKIVRNSIINNGVSADGYSINAAGGAHLSGDAGSVVIAQNLFAKNFVTGTNMDINGTGGLMLRASGSPFVVNNTVADNLVTLTGVRPVETGGIYCSNVTPTDFHSLIIYGNDAAAVRGDNCVPSYSDIDGTFPIGGAGNLSAPPGFVNPASDDYSLQAGSPCIDSGSPDAALNDSDGSRNDMGHTGGPDH